MKNVFTLATLLFATGVVSGVSAQELSKGKNVSTDNYVRNSVCLIMMEDASVPQAEVLRAAFLSAPLSAKYNDHNVGNRVIVPSEYPLDANDIAAFNMACTPDSLYMSLKASGEEAPAQTKFKGGAFAEVMKSMASSMASTVDTVMKVNVARTANKFLLKNNVANSLAAKWFMNNEGAIDNEMKTVVDRGMLTVSKSDAEIANATQAGAHYLLRMVDLEELVGNTFVVVSRFGYKPKDDLINDIMLPQEVAAEVAKQIDSRAGAIASLALKTERMSLKSSMGNGYYVTVDSYMFRLRWNDEINAQFYDLWKEDGSFDMDTFNSMFSLQFIGNERAWARTKAGIFSDKSEEELIRMASLDAVDQVLAKFESKYDQFKTKTPLIVREGKDKKGNPVPVYAVKLGARDGLEGGEIFEVLEKQVSENNKGEERVKYVKKGELAVDKKNIWDNTASKAVEISENGAEAGTEETLLVGKDKASYYEGLLLRMKNKKGKKQ